MEEQQAVPAEAAEEVQEAQEVQAEEPAKEAEEAPTEAVADEPPPAPKKKTAQERIDEITRARREAEREREYWKQVALTKERETKPEPPQMPSIFPPRPALEQFETTAQYEDALLTWHENKKTTMARVVQQREEADTALTSFNERADKLRAEHEDFDAVIETPVFSPVMRNTLLRSENGPEVAYYLGLPQNKPDADRIRSLPLEMQAYELGKLETKLQLAKQTKKVPSAPAPIKPVGMTGAPEKDPSKMSTEEWMKWDRERTIAKIKAKYGGP
jgi:hypothetical protein